MRTHTLSHTHLQGYKAALEGTVDVGHDRHLAKGQRDGDAVDLERLLAIVDVHAVLEGEKITDKISTITEEEYYKQDQQQKFKEAMANIMNK